MGRLVQGLVILGAAIVFVAGTAVGIGLAFSGPEATDDEPTCEVRAIAEGEVLSSNLLMVHVYNASKRAGLANRVKINLERRGFLGGVAQNNPGELSPRNVAVLTDDPQDPRVRLVARQFKGKVQMVEADFATEDGISVLIGPNYSGLKKAPTKTRVKREVTVCVPSIDLP